VFDGMAEALECINTDAVTERARRLNQDVPFFEISAKDGQGVNHWADWLRTEILTWNQS